MCSLHTTVCTPAKSAFLHAQWNSEPLHARVHTGVHTVHSHKTFDFPRVHDVVHDCARRRAPWENQAFLSCAQWCARSCPPMCTTKGLAQGADPRESQCALMYSWHATTCYAWARRLLRRLSDAPPRPGETGFGSRRRLITGVASRVPWRCARCTPRSASQRNLLS